MEGTYPLSCFSAFATLCLSNLTTSNFHDIPVQSIGNLHLVFPRDTFGSLSLIVTCLLYTQQRVQFTAKYSSFIGFGFSVVFWISNSVLKVFSVILPLHYIFLNSSCILHILCSYLQINKKKAYGNRKTSSLLNLFF